MGTSEMRNRQSLPAGILAHTGPLRAAERQWIGEGSQVYVVTGERGRFVLKVDARPEQIALREQEARVLASLRDRRPFVAELLARADHDGQSYFLFSYLPGENMVDALQRSDAAGRRRLVAEFGRVLRRIHAWQPHLPRPRDWLGEALERATRNVATAAVPDPIAANSIYDGHDARQLLAEVATQRSQVGDDIVFCHGDYCLPNVLVEGQRAVGVIDWPAGGYADRRYDLATALWTIRYNLHGDEYIRPFLDAYGYALPPSSLAYFEALYALIA